MDTPRREAVEDTLVALLGCGIALFGAWVTARVASEGASAGVVAAGSLIIAMGLGPTAGILVGHTSGLLRLELKVIAGVAFGIVVLAIALYGGAGLAG